LARLGYRVWVPDLRGYGESDRPPNVADYDLDHLMADVAGLIDASGAKSTLLMAHDWGGVIAWYFAMRQMRPLDRLVMMNLPHPACMERELRRWRQIRRSWYVLFFQIPWLPEALLRARHCRAIGEAFRSAAIDKSRFPDEVVNVYRENAARPGALTAMLNYYRALLRFRRKQRQYGFPVIETPTLLLWGEEDVALCKESTYGTDRFVPNLTLRYLPNVSHWVQQEAPEKVNELLEAWLTGAKVPEVP
jgi:pimeloyl-ACP methyl ester carboxylesterase